MKYTLIIVSLVSSEIWTCSMAYNPPFRFDPQEYIFIGQIVEYISKDGVDTTNNQINQFSGFLAVLVEEIYLPQKPQKYFEIFPLGLGADCREYPFDKSQIERSFPLGFQVRVVARKTKIKFENSSLSNVELEVSPHNQFTISLNFENFHLLNSTTESIFNYREDFQDSLLKIDNQIAGVLGIIDSEVYQLVSRSIVNQQDFELRKDLYRLSISDDDEAKTIIIYRMKDFNALGSFKLINIICENIKNPIIRSRLFCMFKLREELPPLEWLFHKSIPIY